MDEYCRVAATVPFLFLFGSCARLVVEVREFIIFVIVICVALAERTPTRLTCAPRGHARHPAYRMHALTAA